MAPKTSLPVNPKVNEKWYNIRRFMGEKTQENSVMGYSAAYPTGRELMRELRNDAPEKLCFVGKVAECDDEVAHKGPRAERCQRQTSDVYECDLPEYLKADISAYWRGREEGASLLDCLWGELYGSINCAEINDGAITHEQAEFLRNKYLWGLQT